MYHKKNRIRFGILIALLALLNVSCSGSPPQARPGRNYEVEVKLESKPSEIVSLQFKGPSLLSGRIDRGSRAATFFLEEGEWSVLATSPTTKPVTQSFSVQGDMRVELKLETAPPPVAVVMPKPPVLPKKSVGYKIVESEESSIKAIGGLDTSGMSSDEMEALPKAYRMSYRVVVPASIKSGEVRPLVEQIVQDISSANPEIDAIKVFVFNDERLTKGLPNVAEATWAPNGSWSGITAEAANSDNKSSHSLEFVLKLKPPSTAPKKRKAAAKPNLSEEERLKIFVESSMDEERAAEIAHEEYPVPLNPNTEGFEELVQRRADRRDSLRADFKRAIIKKYSITEAIYDEIGREGMKEGWPLEW